MPRGATILFVDDNDTLLRVLSEVLSRAGYRVIQATRAEAAIGVLRSGDVKPSVVISDVDIADWEDHNLVGYLRASFPALPLLMISGYDAFTARNRFGIPAGIPFLQKPFPADALVAAVGSLLVAASEGANDFSAHDHPTGRT